MPLTPKTSLAPSSAIPLPVQRSACSVHRSTPRAFTLIELMVAVSLLTVIILSIGVVFKSTGNAVGLGEATGEMFAKVRAINQQLTADVHGIDKNGFLIIRCYMDSSNPDRLRRFDQISFVSTGKFPNRTGGYQTGASQSFLSENTTSTAARIWYGQLVVKKDPSPTDERNSVAYDAAPISSVLNTADPSYEAGFTLGRQAMLLLNPPFPTATLFPAGYQSISRFLPVTSTTDTPFYTGTPAPTDGATNGGTDNDASTRITSSRVAVAYTTLPQEMVNVNSLPSRRDIAEAYCYRLKTLPSPTTTGVPSSSNTPYLPNGIFRMHPIFSQGVPSFAVDWTDGSQTGGELNWFGFNTGAANSSAVTGATSGTAPVQPVRSSTAAIDGTGVTLLSAGAPGISDAYTAVFLPTDASNWPKALRFTYRITDANDRLNGGRSFVCIVDLP